ncbi:MAG: lipocalin family protein [Deltaproteobacteria bacterium]|nr:lipocalin family protein [Deltaproteobacteria bacterium]
MARANPHKPAPKAALLALCLFLATGACTTTTTERLGLPPLQTVDRVDLSRYTGTWFEIASYPQSFQEGCTGTTATYTLRADGEIGVVNRCHKGSLDGKLDSAEGRARVVDTTTHAKLEVTFFWPFWGDYWIIDLGERYDYAVVGHPSRDYLWILSRTPGMQDAVYQGILERIQAKGYPLDRLQKTLQPTAPAGG